MRENRNCVTFNYVMEYVNKVEPGALLFSLNYVVREHKKVIQRLEEPIESATTELEVNSESITIEKEKVKQE